MTVLQVRQLSTSFATERGRVRVVDDVSLTIDAGESLGLVGESGCGKSITALSIMRLLPQPHGRIDAGEVLLGEQNLIAVSPGAMRARRGHQMAMIFQEPMTALNPVYTIGRQLQEPFRLHRPDLNQHDRIRQAIAMLDEVGIPSPEKRMSDYPHQLSGGMRQRVMIAMALALQPRLLIADEPTTALDVTIQAQILSLINTLRNRHGTAVLFITHDLGVVAETCDRVAVMYAGRIVEQANVRQFFEQPCHPYSRGLLGAIPRLDSQPRTRLTTIPGSVPAIDQFGDGCRFFDRCQIAAATCRNERPDLALCRDEPAAGQSQPADRRSVRQIYPENSPRDAQRVACFRWPELRSNPDLIATSAAGTAAPERDEKSAAPTGKLLEVVRLRKHFPIRGGLLRRTVARVHAVDDVSLQIAPGETLGLVGESGCGKSTVGKTLLSLQDRYQGEVWFDQTPLHSLSGKRLKALRQDIQIIFQDPMESLNPRHTVADIIEEPLIIHRIGSRAERLDQVRQLAARVGLSPRVLHRYPHEFSGGQRQRIGIARAIALRPRLIVCDEPVSALDVSIQSQILNLLLDLQRELDSALLFISHDLAVVKHVSHRVAVMYLGQLVEVADADTLYRAAKHPYTQTLLAAIPQPSPDAGSPRAQLRGEPPSPINPPSGCRFHPRCRKAQARCIEQPPSWTRIDDRHQVACHFWDTA